MHAIIVVRYKGNSSYITCQKEEEREISRFDVRQTQQEVRLILFFSAV